MLPRGHLGPDYHTNRSTGNWNELVEGSHKSGVGDCWPGAIVPRIIRPMESWVCAFSLGIVHVFQWVRLMSNDFPCADFLTEYCR
jgi:hypothetical protein